jgi:hypothetical protein
MRDDDNGGEMMMMVYKGNGKIREACCVKRIEDLYSFPPNGL